MGAAGQNKIGRAPHGGSPSAGVRAYLGVFAADRSSWPCLPVQLGVAGRTDDPAPSADRIVSHGRAGEPVAPPRASVSNSRQPTEREAETAAVGGPATSQSGAWIRIASSRSNRQTWPAHCLLCQFGLARLVPAGRRADAAMLGHLRQGSLVPTSTVPSAVATECSGAGFTPDRSSSSLQAVVVGFTSSGFGACVEERASIIALDGLAGRCAEDPRGAIILSGWAVASRVLPF
jgi:hypothetical protein